MHIYTKRLVIIVIVIVLLLISCFIYIKYAKKAFLNDEKTENIIKYGNGDYIYFPDAECISYDEEEAVLYYNNIIKVYLLSEINDKKMTQLVNNINGEVVGKISGSINYIQILTEKSDLQELNKKVDILMESEDVLYACYDYPIYVSDMTDDNKWGGEKKKGFEEKPGGNDWWAEAVGAYTAWDISEGLSNPIKVGVIDNGFDLEHEDFTISQKSKIQLLTSDDYNTPSDHGTHVSGLIGAANNSLGIRGIADQATLVCAKRINNDDNEDQFTTTELMETIKQMIESGVFVINNSWGQHIDNKEKYLTEISKVYRKDPTNRKEVLVKGFLAALQPWWKDLDEKNVDTILREYDEKYGLYDSYYNLCITRSKSTAIESLIIITELIINSNNDQKFLIIQSAGNGYEIQNEDDNVKGGHNTILNGYFCNETKNIYDLLPEKTRDSFKNKGITFQSIRDHIIIVSGTTIDSQNGYYYLNSQFNYGDNIDICAPGGNKNNPIYSTLTTKDDNKYKKNNEKRNGKIYGEMYGTSMAAPIVSGSAALLWSIDSNLSAEEVKNYLINNSTKAVSTAPGDNREEYPMLNIGMAVKELVSDKDASKAAKMFNQFVSSHEFMYGDTYHTCIYKSLDNEITNYIQSLVEIPEKDMGYLIYDFDQDDIPELLIIGVDGNKEHADMSLLMYEYVDGKIVLSDKKNLSNYDYPFTMSLTASDLEDSPGLIDCYIFGDTEVDIAIEMGNRDNFTANGTLFNFLVFAYSNNQLLEKKYLYYCGSSFDEGYDPDLNTFINELKSLGIQLDSYWDLVFHNRITADYLPNVQEFIHCKQKYLCSYLDFQSWDTNGNEDFLKTSNLYFCKQKELNNNRENSKDSNKNEPLKVEAVNVSFDHRYDNGKECAIFAAMDNTGNNIWEIRTKKYNGAELDNISEISVRNNAYYYVENGVIIAVELLTGKVLWKNKDFGGGLSSWVFDNEGTLYVSGFYNPDLYVISNTGKTKKRINKFNDQYFRPYSISLQKNKLIIAFEEYPLESTGSIEMNLENYSYSLK